MNIDERCVNTIRILAADAVTKAKSGHPGAPLGLAPAMHVLWSKFLNFDPVWINRDRFVLSCGHASALIYTMLHIHSRVLTMDDLKNFRQFGSKTAGHPEKHLIPELEATTGCLGQGISNAVGLAVAQRLTAAKYNQPNYPLINHTVFCFASDGDMMEGVQAEACSFAGHNKLDNLVVFWDNNSVTISGHTELSFSEDVPKRFRAYGWHTINVDDGDKDFKGIESAIKDALAFKGKPVLINLKTTIGYGSAVADSSKVHGTPLTNDQLAELKRKFGFIDTAQFLVDDAVYKYYDDVREKTRQKVDAWKKVALDYKNAYPREYEELEHLLRGEFPMEAIKAVLPPQTDANVATRVTSGKVINALAKIFPGIISGSADLTPSTCNALDNEPVFSNVHQGGRYIEFGIREHGMMAIANGISYYGIKGYVPMVATFFTFIQYLLPALRLASLEHLRVVCVLTHDSIGLGEDGPTHQNVENFAVVRAMPGCVLYRPADLNEVSGAYAMALNGPSRPYVMALSRQNAPPVSGTSLDGTLKGGYIVRHSSIPKIVVVATGTELSIAMEAVELSGLQAIVVSMPSMDVFMEQPIAYRKEVIPPKLPVISVEAGVHVGWEGISHVHLGVEKFGMSAPYQKVYEHFELTKEKIAEKIKKIVHFYEGNEIPNLYSKPCF